MQLEIKFTWTREHCKCNNGDGLNCDYDYNCIEECEIWNNLHETFNNYIKTKQNDNNT